MIINKALREAVIRLIRAYAPGIAAQAGGGGTPAGADTEIQYNNAGAFGASVDFTWNDTAKVLTIISPDDDSASITGVADGSSTGLNIFGGDQTATDTRGGWVNVWGGKGDGVAPGGDFSGGGGEGGATGDGGVAWLTGGSGGATSGNGGDVEISGGTAETDGDGGNVNIMGSTGADGGADGVTTIGDGGTTDYVQITRAGVMSFVGGGKATDTDQDARERGSNRNGGGDLFG